jgi:hypothetical protein
VGLALLLAGCGAGLKASQNTVNFGEVWIGTTATASPVTWTNTTKETLNVLGVLIFDQTPINDFHGGPDPFPATDLKPGDSTPNIFFTFSPTRVANYSGTAVALLPYGAPGGVEWIMLSGRGIAQKAEGALGMNGGPPSHFTPGQPLDFGKVVVPGGSPVKRRFRLLNIGPKPIQVTSSWEVGGQGFSVAEPQGTFTVPARSRVWVTLEFKPPSVGEFNDAVTFSSAGGTHVAGTAVHGEGVKE